MVEEKTPVPISDDVVLSEVAAPEATTKSSKDLKKNFANYYVCWSHASHGEVN
jgi:hypothetical protein